MKTKIDRKENTDRKRKRNIDRKEGKQNRIKADRRGWRKKKAMLKFSVNLSPKLFLKEF